MSESRAIARTFVRIKGGRHVSGQNNRRQFLQASLAAGVGFWAAGGIRGDEKKEEKKFEKLNFACVGVGGKGGGDTDHAAMNGDVVALCDIDDDAMNKKANGEKFKKAQKFNDFREMFAKMGDKIDAVTVSTADHTHAVIAMMAIKAGKHVYCQKPLVHNVAEARALRDAAKKYKVCTQMGNQGCALDNFRTSVEMLRAGSLGTVKEVHVWTNRPTGFWKQAPDVTKRPEPGKQPKHVHWDLFLGPAPERPYAPGYHPFAWRGWRDFGTGALGDMACHTANMPYVGLELGLPTSIEAESEKPNDETFPGWAKITFTFPAKGKRAAVKLFWYEGKKGNEKVLPPKELFQGEKPSGSASLIVAENVTLYSPDDYGATRKLLGKGAKDVKMPEKTLKRRGGKNDEQQKAEWVEAIKANDPLLAFSNFAYASMLTESILLGNAAIKAEKKLEYDGDKGKFTNAEECNKLLSREYRTGYKL
jgi:predicted dehydrogenase